MATIRRGLEHQKRGKAEKAGLVQPQKKKAQGNQCIKETEQGADSIVSKEGARIFTVPSVRTRWPQTEKQEILY